MITVIFGCRRRRSRAVWRDGGLGLRHWLLWALLLRLSCLILQDMPSFPFNLLAHPAMASRLGGVTKYAMVASKPIPCQQSSRYPSFH